ncbi:MAG: hypothetical protein OHK0053_23890 [Microscillaceae bacterium]
MTVYALLLSGCYPDTLRQQLAGTDTIEIVFLDTKTGHPLPEDTLVFASKDHINALLACFSAQKSSPVKCVPAARVFFRRQRVGVLLLEADLVLQRDCAYLTYAYKNRVWSRALNPKGQEMIHLARKTGGAVVKELM